MVISEELIVYEGILAVIVAIIAKKIQDQAWFHSKFQKSCFFDLQDFLIIKIAQNLKSIEILIHFFLFIKYISIYMFFNFIFPLFKMSIEERNITVIDILNKNYNKKIERGI